MKSTQKLTVLFAPMDGWGHINACHGIAEELRDRGHRVVFAVGQAFKGKLETFGFEERVFAPDTPPKTGPKSFTEFVNQNKDLFKLSPLDIIEKQYILGYNKMFAKLKERESQYKEIIAVERPDVIVIDAYIGSPTLTNSDVPFVWLVSAAPLMGLNHHDLPPPLSNLSLTDSKDKWIEFREKLQNIFGKLHKEVNQWFVSNGAPPLPSGSALDLHPRSKHLNIYMTPEEMDYQEIQPLAPNWRRVDGFVRTTDETFEIPESLRERPGKLVLLSMGSLGCSHLDLMIRLTQILGKSKHRFIVNKGPLHDKYDLPDNMWGQPFLPQTAVIPLVDLVITHGGNNTINESFLYGKPMLVLPLFADQYDMAVRLVETRLSRRLHPLNCSDEELLTSVDQMVNDLSLAQRMKAIGERIRKSNDKEVIASLVEDIVSKNNL